MAKAVGGVYTKKAQQVYYRGAKKNAKTDTMQDDDWPQAIFADPQANNRENKAPAIVQLLVTQGDMMSQMEKPSFLAIYPNP